MLTYSHGNCILEGWRVVTSSCYDAWVVFNPERKGLWESYILKKTLLVGWILSWTREISTE